MTKLLKFKSRLMNSYILGFDYLGLVSFENHQSHHSLTYLKPNSAQLWPMLSTYELINNNQNHDLNKKTCTKALSPQ